MEDGLLRSLAAAVEAAPDDTTLRLHYAELLVAADRADDAVAHLGRVLALDPTSGRARELMTQAVARPGPQAAPAAPEDSGDLGSDSRPPTERPAGADSGGGFDWGAAESDVDGVVPPMFVQGVPPQTNAFGVETAGVRLTDVGGMTEVKARLEASFLAPMRNPELRRLYGKSLRGGLLLYGPPGCGKTFLARALAGEMGAAFLAVSLADILDMYIGNSEKNVQELFQIARASAPCVLFLDEIDAIGQKRSLTRTSGIRTTVNQLLSEMDGIGSRNEGVYVLAATNHPWDVDPALLRPGRLDRTLLVLPPDAAAREAILRLHLSERPVESVDLGRLAARTAGYSGADLAGVCEAAAERALLDSARTGVARMIGMADLEAAIGELRPSIDAWMETARNVVLYANASGQYDELATYMRRRGKV
jgi:SpoVK/Ycf46/Vps4 family AAA+-type ATPase